MDGGVLAGRFQRMHDIRGRKTLRIGLGAEAVGRDFGGTRFGQHQVVGVLASQGAVAKAMNMLDLVKCHGAPKRRDAQNV